MCLGIEIFLIGYNELDFKLRNLYEPADGASHLASNL